MAVSVEQYQKYCFTLYRKYKELIDELVEWRNVLRIPINSRLDENIAYLIHRVHQLSPARWKQVLNAIKRDILKYPRGLYETYIELLVTKRLIAHIEELIRTGKTEFESSLKTLQAHLPFVEKALEKGRLKRASGVGVEHAPEWFYMARPENEFYKNAYLERKIEPLERFEEREAIVKLNAINRMNEIYTQHTWHLNYRAVKIALRKVASLIKEEYALRKRIEAEPGVVAVEKLDQGLKILVTEQKREWTRFSSLFSKSLKHAPHKESRGELEKLYAKVMAEIERDLKRF